MSEESILFPHYFVASITMPTETCYVGISSSEKKNNQDENSHVTSNAGGNGGGAAGGDAPSTVLMDRHSSMESIGDGSCTGGGGNDDDYNVECEVREGYNNSEKQMRGGRGDTMMHYFHHCPLRRHYGHRPHRITMVVVVMVMGPSHQ